MSARPKELDVKKDNPISIVKSLDTDVSVDFVVNDFTDNLLSLSMSKSKYNNGSSISFHGTNEVFGNNFIDEVTFIDENMINKLSTTRKSPLSIQMPKFTDEYKRDIEDSWIKHFEKDDPLSLISSVFIDASRSLENQKKEIIQNRLKDLGLNVDLEAEIKQGLKRFSKDINGNETTIYFDSGNGDLKRIVTFKIKPIPFDPDNFSIGFEETYY
ncbi:hypothetical protein [uncultured Polaribacter sp.]|uniref:hypothetical protein n=1 Tax=uncultured Polaribacter sp. TaxID=174711 RepID=UPI00260D1CA4|nr:hypothetical protein [uncultured Polaribacter sp.]